MAILDDFTGTDGQLLQARSGWAFDGWMESPSLAILSNGARAPTINMLTNFWNTSFSSASIVCLEVEAEIQKTNGGSRTACLAVSLKQPATSGTTDGYYFDFSTTSTTYGTFNIYRLTNGVPTIIASSSSITGTGFGTDRWKLRHYTNGDIVLSYVSFSSGDQAVLGVNDTTYTVGGYVGIRCNRDASSTNAAYLDFGATSYDAATTYKTQAPQIY